MSIFRGDPRIASLQWERFTLCAHGGVLGQPVWIGVHLDR